MHPPPCRGSTRCNHRHRTIDCSPAPLQLMPARTRSKRSKRTSTPSGLYPARAGRERPVAHDQGAQRSGAALTLWGKKEWDQQIAYKHGPHRRYARVLARSIYSPLEGWRRRSLY